MVFAAAFVPLKTNLHKMTVNIISFKFHLDQVFHAIVYMLICLYFPAGEHQGLALFKDNSFKKFLLVVLILATITEVVQLAVPYRAFNFIDMAANLVGIGLGVAIMMLLKGIKVNSE